MGTRELPEEEPPSPLGMTAPGQHNETCADVIRVAIVDDHPMMRAGIVWAFGQARGFEVVGEGASAAEAIHLAETLQPDLIFLDINMPGDGVHAAQLISHNYPAVRIIIFTVHEDEQHVVNAFGCGASGYLIKGVSSAELIQTARSVHEGGPRH